MCRNQFSPFTLWVRGIQAWSKVSLSTEPSQRSQRLSNLCVCVSMCAITPLRRTENNFWGLVLSSHLMGSRCGLGLPANFSTC